MPDSSKEVRGSFHLWVYGEITLMMPIKHGLNVYSINLNRFLPTCSAPYVFTDALLDRKINVSRSI